MNAFFRGGEGYGSKYNKVKDGLEQRFPGQLEIIGERQHSRTGDFVVNIALIKCEALLRLEISARAYVRAHVRTRARTSTLLKF